MKGERAPYFVYTAIPVGKFEVRTFYDGGDDSVSKLLEDPGELRYAGWDMRTLDTVRIVEGQFLELRNADRKIIRLYRDGALIARCAADESFLGHASDRSEQKNIRINPVGLVEFTYNFVDVYKRILQFLEPRPEKFNLHVDIKGAHLEEGGKLYLTPYGGREMAFIFDADRKYAPSDSTAIEVPVEYNEIVEVGPAAFRLLAAIYGWFGMKSDKIPFTKKVGNKVVVDPEQIKRLN